MKSLVKVPGLFPNNYSKIDFCINECILNDRNLLFIFQKCSNEHGVNLNVIHGKDDLVYTKLY